MPLAGSRDADRARAHLRWAERYSRNDEPHKAAAHFGRALEYDRRSTKSQKFGVGGGQDTELMLLELGWEWERIESLKQAGAII